MEAQKPPAQEIQKPPRRRTAWWKLADPQSRAGRLGLAVLVLIALPCFATIHISRSLSDDPDEDATHQAPQLIVDGQVTAPSQWFGTDRLGRSLFWRCMLGGAISLTVGISAALISVIIGVSWGALSGYIGGHTDAAMMRVVDILYGLPYILLVVLLGVAVYGVIDGYRSSHYRQVEAAAKVYTDQAAQLKAKAAKEDDPGSKSALIAQAKDLEAKAKLAKANASKPWMLEQLEKYPAGINLLTLILAIGGVSWLTMARVIRGQVLSLREQPFIEAAKACGVGHLRILWTHLLPNLIGPIVVYTTLTVPAAILQESFLSFLGIGIQAPLPSWGNLAADGLGELRTIMGQSSQNRWWLLFWPCMLLGMTLMALNFLGDALRNRFDPKSSK
jgi:oligopeptide transport system permease protein